MLKVAIGGLGAVGWVVARALDGAEAGVRLVAVSAAEADRAKARVASFRHPPEVLPLKELAAAADVVVECLPAQCFDHVARPVVATGGILVTASAGALMERNALIAEAARAGARIFVPSGAILGLDGLRAAREAGLKEVRLTTRKPPRSFGPLVPHLGRSVPADSIAEPLLLFSGSARQAIRLFPANVNVAAAVSLAGVGPDDTQVEVWADPRVARNTHRIEVRSTANEFTIETSNLPDPDNPRSSTITGHSIVALLRRLTEPLVIGT